MKMTTLARFSCKASALLFALVVLVGSAKVGAQSVLLTFSGGGGSPFVISWSTPIVYTLTTSTSNFGIRAL